MGEGGRTNGKKGNIAENQVGQTSREGDELSKNAKSMGKTTVLKNGRMWKKVSRREKVVAVACLREGCRGGQQ